MNTTTFGPDEQEHPIKPLRILINLTSPKNKRWLNSAYVNEEMTADPADNGC